jgi:diacylglycerol kinase (ATP)
MTRVAVIAHAGKSLGGGLAELRRALERHGVEDPFWREVPKSRKAPKQVERALKKGCELVFVWGGDGMVQRCIDVLAGSPATLAIVPAGTANLLATNLDIPKDIEAAVELGLAGGRRKLDVGRINGECFAVMAGAGFDARMIAGADGTLKDRFGRLAYLWSGGRSLRGGAFQAKVVIDGHTWYRGTASCVLVGNVGKLFGGVEVFEDASPDDGRLDVGVVTAEGVKPILRTLAQAAVGKASRSPYARETKGRSVRLRFDRKVPYELDGGARTKLRKLRIDVQPAAVEVCVPKSSAS